MPKIETGNGPQLLVTCGGCVHFNKMRHPQLPKVCKEEGIREYAKPCEKFQVNWQLFNADKQFSDIVHSISNDDLPLIVALLNAEISTRIAKYHYNMVVYVRLFGEDYISNYFKCNVICAKGRYVYVQGAKSKYYGVFLKKSVLTEKQFLTKIKELALAKKYRDPKLESYTDWKPAKRGIVTIKDVPHVDQVYKREEKQLMTWTTNDFE